MKLQFKQQQFQIDAARAVVEVFAGQIKPARESRLILTRLDEELDVFANAPVTLSDEQILSNLRGVQSRNKIPPSEKLIKTGDAYNLTVEMETGVGKTYTYIKTMHELNRAYGWRKFIVVVPSVAIREGVLKTFQMTAEHFGEEYGAINFFVYNSARLEELAHFAESESLSAMIINSQAFNATGKDARRIRMELDEFQSRKPIELVARTNPVLIIDEPQSVEGAKTKASLLEFKPLLTLRYSATHREIYNMIYRLDALDAYNQHLVKKIFVTGIRATSISATAGFVYLERINLSANAPTATLHFDCKGKSSVRRKILTVGEGFNLYEKSGGLEEYRDNFIVLKIDGRDNSVEFLNGVKIFAGDVIGEVGEEILRRIQIRETIKAHLQREAELFGRGIKVLSLFFIDEVAHYRLYDAAGNPCNGDFAAWFEEEYSAAVKELEISSDAYKNYLASIPAEKTHAGYFSVDKKGKLTDSKFNGREKISDDTDAYDLIMRNKEKLLDFRTPVRFIFSHSALREGWDNPNVFQICTLKQSGSDIRKRQEVGRGLRLCVNQFGERQDGDNYSVNALTVIAGESYDDFTRKLQSELAEITSHRPRKVTEEFFIGKTLSDGRKIDAPLAKKIYKSLIRKEYLDDDDALTEKYFTAKKNGTLELEAGVEEILAEIYDAKALQPENSRRKNFKVTFDRAKFEASEFQALWQKISAKTFYTVKFDTRELIDKIITALNERLRVAKFEFSVASGTLSDDGTFTNQSVKNFSADVKTSARVEYDVIDKLMAATRLTRKTLVKILRGMDKKFFAQINRNPEEFILSAAKIISDETAAAVQVKYTRTGETYDASIFIDDNLYSDLLATKKNLYDRLISDSNVEKKFAAELEADSSVVVYVKLPRRFTIPTPVGNYNPDWAIVLREGKEIYFVAETKGSTDYNQLRGVEKAKIDCAGEHFKLIASGGVIYETVKDFADLRARLP